MARPASASSGREARPGGTILVPPGRRFTLEVTATILQARAAWSIYLHGLLASHVAGIGPQEAVEC